MSSDACPSSPSPSAVGRRRCSTCRVKLQRKDQHSSCFVCLGSGHAALSATCASCLALPREESERRRAFFAATAPRPDSSQDEESVIDWAPLDLPPVPAEWGDCEDGEVSEVDSLLTLDEVVSNPEPDRFPLDHMPGLYSTAAAIMDAPLPPQPNQRVEDFTSGYATTRGRRRAQPTLCPRMDPIVHYATREWPKPLAAKRPALGYGMYCNVQDWSWTGGVPDIRPDIPPHPCGLAPDLSFPPSGIGCLWRCTIDVTPMRLRSSRWLTTWPSSPGPWIGLSLLARRSVETPYPRRGPLQQRSCACARR
uniref:Uncharacterized protein n=1 Tax=Knipowitschia caucasica TaxID=637954 RepID=A0AAV2JXE2_KNICA